MTFEEFLNNQRLTEIVCLTEGACGYSFKAYDQSLKRNVFVKFYETCSEANEGILSEPRKIATLFSEVNSAALHIAAVYSASLVAINENQYIQIITEYCDGESVYKFLHQNKLFVYDALEFGKQIIDGIYVLHQKNIVHRDIKPSNLVISNGNIKIIDLGGAKEIPYSTEYLVTNSKHSIFYRPLESFEPKCIYGKFSDIYQIGLVVYELINGPIIDNMEHYVVDKIKKQYEKRFNCTYEKMEIWDMNQVQDESIKYLVERDKLQEVGAPSSRWYTKKLKEIVKQLTNKDYNKRIPSCSYARIILSSYKGPNWRLLDNEHLEIKNWKGYDYKFVYEKGIVSSKKAKHGTDIYRNINSITTWDDVYNEFFKDFD